MVNTWAYVLTEEQEEKYIAKTVAALDNLVETAKK